MSNPPNPPERTPAQIKRAKLLGRLMIVAFGLLILAYIIPTFMNRPH